jgi:hypothetical protein
MSLELRALKSFRYAKVRLQPGDTFQAKNDRDALVLTFSLGGRSPLAEKVEGSNGTRESKAEKESKEASRRQPEAADDGDKHVGTLAEAHTEDRAALRLEYQRLWGKKPFAGWTAAQLRERIRDLR